MNIEIEHVAGANNSALLEAYLKLFNDAGNLPFLSYTGIPFTRELVSGWLDNAAQSGIDYYTAVGADGEITGIMVARRHCTEGFEILGVVVNSKARRSGVGGALIENAVKQAKEYGFKAVDVAVFADNARMLSLVIRHGFKPVGIEYRKRFDGEDVVYLKRFGI